MQHTIHWFEIPVTDLPRATVFYATVLGLDATGAFRSERAGSTQMALFPCDRAAGGVGGALVAGGPRRPAAAGVVVYLNAGQDIRGAVERAVAAGGQVAQPVTDIGDPGLVALIRDTEGNLVGLHQPPAASSSTSGA